MKTNTKLASEDFSQTNSSRNLSFPTFYNNINNFYLTRKSSDINKNENLVNIYSDTNKIVLNKKYIEKEQPKNEEEIKEFVDDLLEYINYIISLKYDKYKMRNLIFLKTKIEVRNFWSNKVTEFSNLKDFETYVYNLNKVFGYKLKLEYIKDDYLIFFIIS